MLFFDLIIFGILAIFSFIFVIGAILSNNISREIIDRISWLREVAIYIWFTFGLFLLVMNIIYIFYFRHWKRLLYIFISGIFSAIAFAGVLFMALIGIDGKATDFESLMFFLSFFLTISIYPAVHLILAWKITLKKRKLNNKL